jgi:hypothetical protein
MGHSNSHFASDYVNYLADHATKSCKKCKAVKHKFHRRWRGITGKSNCQIRWWWNQECLLLWNRWNSHLQMWRRKKDMALFATSWEYTQEHQPTVDHNTELDALERSGEMANVSNT